MEKGKILWIFFQLWITIVSGKKLLALPSLMEADSTTHVCLLLQDLAKDEGWNESAGQNKDYNIDVTINYLEINQTEQHFISVASYLGDYHTCFPISTPDEAGQITAEVNVSVSYRTTKGDKLNKNIISYRNKITSRVIPLVTLIQTDKPLYKPGQTVKFRVMTMDHNLYPQTDGYSLIKIESPNGVTMKQWKDVKAPTGVVSLDMPLSVDPILGKWKITATHGPTNTEKVFTVDEFVLPKFDVTIHPPSYFLPTTKAVSATVCAIYTYGKPVEGDIEIRLCYESNYNFKPRPCAKIKDTIAGGCYEFSVDADELVLKSRNYSQHGNLVITANVTEEQTGITLSGSSTGPSMTMRPLNINIEDDSNGQFKPGFPYKARVIVTNPDGTPAPEETINITAKSVKSEYHWKNFLTSDADGFIHFSINDFVKGVGTIYIFAERIGDESDRIFSSNKYNHRIEHVITYHVITEWYSSSDSFIYIPDIDEAAECDTTVTLDVYYTAVPGKDYTFMSMIRAGDNVISSGVTEIHAHDVAFVSNVPSDDKFVKLTRVEKEDVKWSIRMGSLDPVFLPTTEKIKVHQGETATLKCLIRNLGERTLMWRKEGEYALIVIDGQMFAPDENITTELLTNSEDDVVSALTIKNSDPIHSGTYVCQLSPGRELYAYRITLEVLEYGPPKVLSVSKGGLVSLPCEVKNIPEDEHPNVAWFDEFGTMLSLDDHLMIDNPRFGIDRPADNQWNFVIEKAELKDTGTYVCKADNSPMQTQAVQLDVFVLYIKITGDKYVVVGDDIVINCTIQTPQSDPAQIEVSWFIDGTMIRARDKMKTIVRKTVGKTIMSQLTVEKSRLNDSATYTCRGSNLLVASMDVKVVRFKVKPTPVPVDEPMFLPTPKNITIYRGEAAVFKCHIRNLGNKKITWKMPFQMIGDKYAPDKRIEVDVENNETDVVSIMTIMDTKPIYSGIYTCRITGASKLFVYHIKLQVLEFESPETITVNKGYLAVLPCPIDIPQGREVVWTDEYHTLLTRGDKRIIDDPRFSVQQLDSKESLLVREVESTDSGRYICQVNTNPVMTKAVVLDVKVLDVKRSIQKRSLDPVFLPTTEKITVHQGETATLKCHIRNIGERTLMWRKEGEYALIVIDGQVFASDENITTELLTNSENDFNSTLTIKDSDPIHSGTFVCQLSPGRELYAYRITLEVLEYGAPKVLSVSEGDFVSLPCEVKNIPEDEHLYVAWFDEFGTMLSLDDHLMIDNPRFGIDRPADNQWNFVIGKAEPKDTGTYVCKADTSPMQTQAVQLDVFVLYMEIAGDEYVVVGDDIVINCTLPTPVSDPAQIKVSWFIDERKIRARHKRKSIVMKTVGKTITSQLTVEKSRLKDGGTYICRSSNFYVAFMDVNVVRAEDKPTTVTPVTEDETMFLPTPKNITIYRGEAAVFKCHIRNLGNKTITWKMPFAMIGDKYVSDKRIEVDMENNETDVLSIMTIKDTKPICSGIYTCRITGASKLLAYHIKLQVLEFESPETITVNKGDLAVLPCPIDIPQGREVVWTDEYHTLLTRGDKRIIDDPRFSVQQLDSKESLLVREVESTDSGRYICQVNTNPIMTKAVVLNVKVLAVDAHVRRIRTLVPRFMQTPTNITVRRGGKAVLTCYIRHLGPKTVVWTMQGTDVPIAIGEYMYSPDKHLATELLVKSETDVVSTLTFTEIQRNHSGTYICQISSTQLYTYDITLNVLDKPIREPTFLPTPKNITVHEGEKAVLKCHIRNLGPKTVIWSRQGTDEPIAIGELVFSPDRNLATEILVKSETDVVSTLTFTESQRNHSGTYICQISSTRLFKYHITLNVLDKPIREPTFLPTPKKITVHEGETAVLKCHIRNLGNKTILWADKYQFVITYGDRSIIDDSRFSVERPDLEQWNLLIQDVRQEDGGKYTCMVSTTPVKEKTVELQVLQASNQNVNRLAHFKLEIPIKKAYSPYAKLLLMYMRDDGEVVASTLQFNVKGCFSNKANLSFAETRVRAGEGMDIKLTASKGSTCFVGIVDKRGMLLGGNNQITPNDIFGQVGRVARQYHHVSYNEQDLEYCQSKHNVTSASSGRPPFYQPVGRDSLTAFRDATIAVVSDGQLQSRTCIDAGKQPSVREKGEPGSNGTRQKEMETNEFRNFFPETWLWHIEKIRDNQTSLTITTTLPDTITEWVGNTVCTSPVDGVGVSEVTGVTAFKPFFVSLTMPYSAVRGEKLPVVVTVFNNLSECVPAVSTNNKRSCAGEKIGNLKAGVDDRVQRQLLIEAEGVQKELTWSSYICVNDNGVENRTAEWNVSDDTVPDSYRATFSVVGDIMGPTLQNLDNLLRMPYGSGEQNMASWAPNIYVLKYLSNTHQLTREIKEDAETYMTVGYQRQMKYRHVDSSYSAWGENYYKNTTGNLWLTVFVVKSTAQSSDFITVDDEDVLKSVKWIVNKQDERGCFPTYGKVFSSYMKGGLADGDNLAGLTAFTLIALLEADLGDEFIPYINKGFACLDMFNVTTTDTYTLSVMLYAYTIRKSDSRRRYEVMTEVQKRKVSSDGMVHWKREETEQKNYTWSNSWHRAPSAEIEMTAYVLLSILEDSDVANDEAHSIVQWLTKQRNPYGGFSSTQDTVVALQALAKFGQLTYSGKTGVTVEVNYSVDKTWFFINPHDSLVTQSEEISEDDNKVEVTATGSGCVLAQVTVNYNVYKDEVPCPAFDVKVDIYRSKTDSMNCAWRSLSVCARFLKSPVSNMAIAEIRMPTGWIPVKSSVQELVKTNKVQRMDLNKNYVQLYFDELTNVRTCVSFEVEQDIIMDPKPALVKVYDYYETNYAVTTMYEISTLTNCGTKQEIPLGNIGLDCDVVQCRDETPFPIEMTCPACPSEKIDNDALIKLTCKSTAVYKMTAGKKGLYSMKAKANLRGKKKTTITDVNVNYMMLGECSCPILEGSETRVLIFTETLSLNSQSELIVLKESDTVMSYDPASVKLIRTLASRPRLCSKIQKLQRKGTKRSLSKLQSLKKKLGL